MKVSSARVYKIHRVYKIRIFGQKVKNLQKSHPEPADHFHFENFRFKYTASGSGKPNKHFLRKYVPPTE